MRDNDFSDMLLPPGWGKNVKSAVLHIISLAHYAIISAHGWAAAFRHAGNKNLPIVELKQVA